MKSCQQGSREPRINIGTVGEFQMRGLLIPEKYCDPLSGNATDRIVIPAGKAVMLALDILNSWKIPIAQCTDVPGVTPDALESNKHRRFPTAKAVLQRIEDIHAMHKALMLLAPCNPEYRTQWFTSRNNGFGGKGPIDIVLTDGTQEVRDYLDGCLD